MVDVPVGDQLIHCLEVPLVDLFIEASDERLVFRNTHCLSLQPQIYLQLPTNGRPAPAVRQGTAMVHAYVLSATAQAPPPSPVQNLFSVVSPTGFEPVHPAPEAGTLSRLSYGDTDGT